MAWLVLIYVVALAALLVTALWSVDSFTGELNHHLTFDNIKEITSESLYRTVTLRTLGVAL
ncbi:MAG: spermidine/putrescine transporter permease, partial [Aeromicrobium sp.]|nr:spermidine/putrescine transporter permease [Aeromicrobium sp.]